MHRAAQFSLHVVATIIIYLGSCDALMDGLYCGRENCYDVLNITRESSTLEITRAYRQLAKLHHPDRHRTAEAKEEAGERFKIIGKLPGNSSQITEFQFFFSNHLN